MKQLIFMPKPFVMFCLALCFTTQSISAEAETPQQIAKNSFQSVVLLVMEDATGQPVSLGSGFFVRENEIATNFHVIEGASRGYAKIVGQKTKYDIEGTTCIDPNHDLVILKIQETNTGSLQLGNSDVVEVGEVVYAVGNPQGLEGTFSQGIVSSVRTVGKDKLLQITAPISPGSSGGPVLNPKGEVIGVSVATFKGGQNLNFAIPSNYLKVLLGQTRPASPLGGVKSSRRSRSLFDNISEGKITDAVIGENFTYDGTSLPTGAFSFSIRNKLREPVCEIYCLLVFYDTDGNPIDIMVEKYSGSIPGGLAKRITGNVDESVEKLNNPTPAFPYVPDPPRKPKGKVEFRILDFKMVE